MMSQAAEANLAPAGEGFNLNQPQDETMETTPGSMKWKGGKRIQVSNAVKKKRINFRLRKLISPKSPITVLNEMAGPVTFQFVDHPPMPPMPGMSYPTIMFNAQCELEGTIFTGLGPTKQIAKNICAEHAIQYLVIKKSTDPQNRVQTDEDGQPLQRNQMMDETPWAQLASLALFKLFNDWQAQGHVLPPELLKPLELPVTNLNLSQSSMDSETEEHSDREPPPPAKVAKMNPDGPPMKHPVQLLNELRGPQIYSVVEQLGSGPSSNFVMSCQVEGITFKAKGRAKKDAKKNCAILALKQLHNIEYPEYEELLATQEILSTPHALADNSGALQEQPTLSAS